MTAEMAGPAGDQPSKPVTISYAKDKLHSLVDRAQDGDVTYITRGGRVVGALVPAEVAQRHEQMEDDYWSQAAKEALEAEDPSDAIPLGKVIAALELRDQPQQGCA